MFSISKLMITTIFQCISYQNEWLRYFSYFAHDKSNDYNTFLMFFTTKPMVAVLSHMFNNSTDDSVFFLCFSFHNRTNDHGTFPMFLITKTRPWKPVGPLPPTSNTMKMRTVPSSVWDSEVFRSLPAEKQFR